MGPPSSRTPSPREALAIWRSSSTWWSGHEAAVLFVLQRPDAGRIVAARRIDPVFSETLARAEEAGVRVLGRRCRVTWEGIALAGPVPAGTG